MALHKTQGVCFRNPPTAQLAGAQGGQSAIISIRPIVKPEEFCGEWKAKPFTGVNPPNAAGN